ncbi:SAM-dependent methyltransferase [Nocardia zapadnayensis]|nr:SAM-dependent methyltransferase [Nocardia zapadnayensis]MCX0273698.1 SAM-dependent methyltransferase [Nocardia zapadnayensis]
MATAKTRFSESRSSSSFLVIPCVHGGAGRGPSREMEYAMTKDRRRKAEIRAHKAETGAAYLVARRQLEVLESGSPDSTDSVPTGVEILPPLKGWTRPSYCRFWTDTAAKHGPLMMVAVSPGPRWWELDDLVRDAAGQNRPAEQRDLWISFGGGLFVTTREHLPAIAAGPGCRGCLAAPGRARGTRRGALRPRHLPPPARRTARPAEDPGTRGGTADHGGNRGGCVRALTPGSFVAITHYWDPADGSPGHELARGVERRFLERGLGTGWYRSREEIVSYFDGLELVDPGVVPVDEWWPSGPPRTAEERLLLGGVGRKGARSASDGPVGLTKAG